MQYMRENLPDDYGLLALQDKILEIMVYVDKLCRENGIDYCLMGGSALGSKRHGGFIPWDDDLDIFMTPDQYDRFRQVFEQKADHDRFYLQEWGKTDDMVTISKVRMNHTTYLEDSFADWDIHQGIYIDIFILHVCPDNRLLQLHQCLWAKYVIMKGLAIRNYTGRGGFLGFCLKVMRLMPDRLLVRHGLRQVYRYRNKKTAHFCNFMGKAVFNNAIYPRAYFEKTVYAPFETVELRVPEQLHAFLSGRFGDYMKIPSPERIRREQHAQTWDTEQDFSHYVACTAQFRDEARLI